MIHQESLTYKLATILELRFNILAVTCRQEHFIHRKILPPSAGVHVTRARPPEIKGSPPKAALQPGGQAPAESTFQPFRAYRRSLMARSRPGLMVVNIAERGYAS